MNNNYFDIELNVTNFPEATNIQTILHNEHVKEILRIIKNNMLVAYNTNVRYIRLQNLQNYKAEDVLAVRNALTTKHYTITDIEDIAGVNMGIKISW